MRWCFLAIHDRRLDFTKSAACDHFRQLHLGKAQPGVVVKCARLLEAMAKEIQNNEAASWFEDTICFGESLGGLFGVVEGL